MLDDAAIERILSALPMKTIGVLGDLFLDRYLDIDARLTEPSIETGLDAYQVVRVRSYPGAAGTVINNLAALGVGRIVPISAIGDDGEGHELRQALGDLQAVDPSAILHWSDRRTPTYTKPMLQQPGQAPRELNRLDIKNRTPTPADISVWLGKVLEARWPELDALLVLDQVSEADCGVVTASVRETLERVARTDTDRFVLADSRERINQFRYVALKPNRGECTRVTDRTNWIDGAIDLARRAERTAYVTTGEEGMVVVDAAGGVSRVTGFPVTGPTDPVGAGDSCSAGIACAMVAGFMPNEAAAFGNLVASITVQQIGVTGTASPAQVRQRWAEVHRDRE